MGPQGRRRECQEAYKQDLERRFPFLPGLPVLFISTLEQDFLRSLFALIDQVYLSFCKRVPTGSLNQFSRASWRNTRCRCERQTGQGQQVGLHDASCDTSPAFALFVGHPDNMTRPICASSRTKSGRSTIFRDPIRLMIRKSDAAFRRVAPTVRHA